MKSLTYGAVLLTASTTMVGLTLANTVACSHLDTPQVEPIQTAADLDRTSRKWPNGRLIVEVEPEPIALFLDDVPMVYDAVDGVYTIDATQGSHVLQVRNAESKEVAQLDVHVASGRRNLVRYNHHSKSFALLGNDEPTAAARSEPEAAPHAGETK